MTIQSYVLIFEWNFGKLYLFNILISGETIGIETSHDDDEIVIMILWNHGEWKKKFYYLNFYF